MEEQDFRPVVLQMMVLGDANGPVNSKTIKCFFCFLEMFSRPATFKKQQLTYWM